MRMYDIIKKKRDGGELTERETEFFVKGITDGEIPDYQVSALLMAIYFQGMTDREMTSLTMAMAHSGDIIDLSGIDGATVDKHSTGGVGDKTTLIVAPIVASLGGKIAKMSGGGLGHTGGTKDKLESIEGFRTDISPTDFLKQVNEIGICLASQSGNLAPADKKMYALRDVTATVENSALIASSVMSKKIASGADNIVLDVKTGSGAFMKTVEDSRSLAEKMVKIGKSVGKNMCAVITNMDIPLGCAVGNTLEVLEAIEVLRGGGDDDLRELCVVLAANMLAAVNGKEYDECRGEVLKVLKNGRAFEKFKQTVKAQGGNVRWIEDTSLFPKAKFTEIVTARQSGYISRTDAEKVGIAAMRLGAGREKIGDGIDYGAGIVLEKKVGDYVDKGDTVARLYTNDESKICAAAEIFDTAVCYSDEKVEKAALIYDIVK